MEQDKLAKKAAYIKEGKAVLGIELGSTTIKLVLVDDDYETLSAGSFLWENVYSEGRWTYALDTVWQGLQSAYQELKRDVQDRYQVELTELSAIGVSAMMHGLLVFDEKGEQLAPFLTWRNNHAKEAASILTDAFSFYMPERWSVAQLYHAMQEGADYVKEIAFMTTLAGYVHWKLTGEKVLGIGDASGMFPIDTERKDYDEAMLKTFGELSEAKAQPWTLRAILPRVLVAGDVAGQLTDEGARLLDTSGGLTSGAIFAPPEGDVGTTCVATHALKARTGCVSAGTSAFSMHILERPLSTYYKDIDICTTPDGSLLAQVHSNNCSSEINAWAGVFLTFAKRLGKDLSPKELYALLFGETEDAARDTGGLIAYATLAGESLLEVERGRPLTLRTPDSQLTLGNFFLAQLYAAFAPLSVGLDILKKEQVEIDVLTAQGGLFKTPRIAQQALADVLAVPVAIQETAGEGGPWGMAVLAHYAKDRHSGESKESLIAFLDTVFANVERTVLRPTAEGEKGAAVFLERYRKALPVERMAASVS